MIGICRLSLSLAQIIFLTSTFILVIQTAPIAQGKAEVSHTILMWTTYQLLLFFSCLLSFKAPSIVRTLPWHVNKQRWERRKREWYGDCALKSKPEIISGTSMQHWKTTPNTGQTYKKLEGNLLEGHSGYSLLPTENSSSFKPACLRPFSPDSFSLHRH